MKSVSGMIFGILGVALLIGGAMAGQSGASTAQEGNDDVRVMTYNIRHGQGNDECTEDGTPEATPEDGEAEETPEGSEPARLELDGTPEGTSSAAECDVDLERITEVIASLEPDIVALQEVDRFWDRSGGIDQPTELVEALDINACFGANLSHEADGHADRPHQYGTLILSRYPILSCDNTFLANREGWEQRGLLEVRVEIDGLGEVAILNTHLQNDREGNEEAVPLRSEQAEAIAERIADLDVPVILMGDFNAEPDDEELSALRDLELGSSVGGFATLQDEEPSTLQDAWLVGGDEDSEGNTSPASPDRDAERRIDSIFVSSDFEVVSAEVPVTEDTLAASDHLPVVADLAPAVPEAATPSADDDVTPESTAAADEAPVTEPDLIVAPTMEPEEETPPIQQDEPESQVPGTEEPEAQPTEEPEPTEEPTAVVTEEPEVEPTEEPVDEAPPTEELLPTAVAPIEPPVTPEVEAPGEPEFEQPAPPDVAPPAPPEVVPPAVEPPVPPDEVPPVDD